MTTRWYGDLILVTVMDSSEIMASPNAECVRIWHACGDEHRLTVSFGGSPYEVLIRAMYEGGCADLQQGAEVALWRATYEPPTTSDDGHLWLGDGRIDLVIDSLRGLGIGSLLMRPLIRWAKALPCNVPVVPINLQWSDARTDLERERRNRFYEKLGFVFEYKDRGQTFGAARPMLVSDLITPEFKMSRGWQVESISGSGSVL